MAEANWTRPEAYLADAVVEHGNALARHAARQLHGALVRVADLLDETAYPGSRHHIAVAREAAVAALRHDDAIHTVLAARGPVRIADVLRELCVSNPFAAAPSHGPADVSLTIRGEGELSWAQPDTARAVIAAAMEMLQEVATGPQLRLTLDLRDGRLALTAEGSTLQPTPVHRSVPTGSPLDRLAGLLGAALSRRGTSRVRSVRLVVPTRNFRMQGDAG